MNSFLDTREFVEKTIFQCTTISRLAQITMIELLDVITNSY
jgi:hypothetical protein